MCFKPNTRPNKATLFHVLNHCPSFLGEQERFRWRNNSVLSYMTLTIKEHLPDHIKVYADLEGHKVNGGTIAQELTVCFEKTDNIQSALQRKMDRYSALSADIEERGYSCKNIPFEVGSSKSILTIIHKLCSIKTSFNQNSSKSNLLCSYTIYLSREDTWNNNTLLSPVK
jgi:hypothetical protein